MKKHLTFSLLLLCSMTTAQTVIQTGNWDETSTWQAGNIADLVTENVGFNTGPFTVTLESGNNYTVGNVVLASAGHLSIEGTLSIGNNSNTRNLTGNASRSINLSGSLTIWGDLTLGDGASIVSSGTLIVKGNVVLGNNSSIVNSGNMTINGNFTGGTSTAVITSAPIGITGDIVVGTSSSLTRPIGVTVSARSCTGPAAFCGFVLPVELISFECHSLERGLMLEWKASMEKNFDQYEIQRASNGSDFEILGTRSGKGYDFKDIENTYTFEDKVPLEGRNYYRLKMIDLDGQFEYSKIILGRWQGERTLFVSPNPSTNEPIHVKTNFNSEPGDKVRVYNIFGQSIMEFSAAEDITIYERLAAGAYILEYSSAINRYATKFWVK